MHERDLWWMANSAILPILIMTQGDNLFHPACQSFWAMKELTESSRERQISQRLLKDSPNEVGFLLEEELKL